MSTKPLDLATLPFENPQLARARSCPRRIGKGAWSCGLLGVGVWAFLLAALISLYVQPTLRIHDEFSYLLAADTLLHGRLANPTPPAWEALQSLHIVMQPSYASKYPLGVGWLIAAGWLLVGTPLAGSWLGAGLMATSTTWMLAGALPKRLAILGGLVLALNPFLQLAWSQSLVHGFLPAAGCALLTGGVLRLRRRLALSNALASGCGVALLSLSRPFEGLCCTAICAALLWYLWNRHPLRQRMRMALAACGMAGAPIALALGLIAAHNRAVTGEWIQMPYQLHERQYGVAPLFVFGSPNLENAAQHTNLPAAIANYHAVDSLNWYRERAGWAGWGYGLYEASGRILILGFPFAAVFAISGFRWTGFRLTRSLCVAMILQVAASSTACWVYAHYLAPLIPWLLLLSLLALRLSRRQLKKSDAPRLCLGRLAKRRPDLTQVALLGIFIVQVACVVVYADIAQERERQSWSRRRQAAVEQLTQAGAKHLVLVRYAADHNVHQEWVYNAADPLNSRIVWARYEHGQWVDELLANYAADRSVWEIAADDPQAKLQPFRLPFTADPTALKPDLLPDLQMRLDVSNRIADR